jgi:hypothetical protein
MSLSSEGCRQKKVSHAMAQAVRYQLSTAVVPVRAQVRSCGICGEQSGIGAGFVRIIRFPLPILIPTVSHSSGTGIIGRQIVAGVPRGLSLTPPQETKEKRDIFSKKQY